MFDKKSEIKTSTLYLINFLILLWSVSKLCNKNIIKLNNKLNKQEHWYQMTCSNFAARWNYFSSNQCKSVGFRFASMA